MKKLILLLSVILISITYTFSQSPQAFKYQAVVRGSTGEILENQAVSFQISIRNDSAVGTILYQETHTTSTNQFGLANLEIGNGIPVSGTFADIDWGNNSKFLEVELDPDGDTTFILMGNTELISVPYALYAENSGNGDDNDWTLDADTLYSATDSTVTIKNSNVGIGTLSPITRLHVSGRGAFGNSINSAKANRALNLISTDAVMRIWRVTDNTSIAPGVELVWGNQPAQDDNGNFWWDLYLDGLNGSFNFRDRSFGQGNTSRLTIDNAGNVGIGTTKPDRKLHIAGDMKIEEMEIGSFSNSFVTWDNADSTLKRILPSAINDTDWTVIGNNMYATVSGNVGIGVTTPLTPLHVHGKGAFGNAVTSTKANRALNLISSDAVMRIWRVTDNTSFDPGVELVWGNQPSQDDAGNFWWDFYLKGSDGSFNIRDRSFGQDNQTRLAIDAFGNVGLGTMNPDEKLHVAGAFKLEGMVFGSLSDSLVTWDPADSTLKVIASSTLRNDKDWTIDADTIYSAADSTVIIKGGNVGIGTPTPTHTFDVMGEARIEMMNLDNTLESVVVADPLGVLHLRDAATLGGFGLAEHLTIAENGNIGIGTNTPTAKAHIKDVLRLEPRNTYPKNPEEGDIFVHADNHNIYCYLNGKWEQMNN